MLDSSPVALPSRRPLKRSASTASLPTPPRTHRKHASGRSRGSCDSDSDDHVLLTSDEENEGTSTRKKRRLGRAEADAAADEEAFWLGGPATPAGLKQQFQDKTQALDGPSMSKKELPLVYKRKLAQQQQQEQQTELVAPVSPPPSRRRVVKTLPLPSTPPRRRAAGKKAAVARDSPENPFLDTPRNDDEIIESPPESSANPSPRTPDRTEKPFVYMVFRGTRKAYPNPLWDHKNNRPLLPPKESELDINDPRFEPSDFCAPKVLFPDARRKRRNAPRAAKKRAVSPSGDEGEGLGERLDLEITPKKLDFGRPKQPKTPALVEKNRKTLEEEFKSVGEGLSA